MAELFKGFLWLRLVGFVGMLIVVAVVLGIWSLTRGSDALGVAILAGVVVFTAGVGSAGVRRARRRSRRRNRVQPGASDSSPSAGRSSRSVRT
ncbi:MAG TPA: hypothetical protein VG410_09410 [Solirubrobacteraceae bacterium]|nr:hypothetical protein [Solirubrobacteraceae bacterium]